MLQVFGHVPGVRTRSGCSNMLWVHEILSHHLACRRSAADACVSDEVSETKRARRIGSSVFQVFSEIICNRYDTEYYSTIKYNMIYNVNK